MMDPDPDTATPTTRLSFLSGITRRAAHAVPRPGSRAPAEEAPELPPPGEMIEPYLADEAFFEDVQGANEEGLHVWWLGQSGFLVQVDGEHLLLDPYLSDSLTETYAELGTPFERVTGRVIAPERLAFVDVVVSSNSQLDHLDPGTLPGVLSGTAKLVCAAGSESLALARSGHAPHAALAVGDDVQIGGYRIEAVPAYHDAAPEAVGYVIRNGDFALYHAGDTRRVQGIAESVALHGVDVAFVPVNGTRGNMGGADAARLAYEAAAAIAIPCHYEMFRLDTASPARFVAECIRLGQEYRLLAAGEEIIVDP
jgi:L-ascorbate metabolism protein UlaG (beta-lactamase superfamily)